MKNGRRKDRSAFFVSGRSWEAIIWKPAQKKTSINRMKHAYKIKSHTFLRTFRVQTNGQMAFQKIPRHISVLLGFLFYSRLSRLEATRQKTNYKKKYAFCDTIIYHL